MHLTHLSVQRVPALKACQLSSRSERSQESNNKTCAATRWKRWQCGIMLRSVLDFYVVQNMLQNWIVVATIFVFQLPGFLAFASNWESEWGAVTAAAVWTRNVSHCRKHESGGPENASNTFTRRTTASWTIDSIVKEHDWRPPVLSTNACLLKIEPETDLATASLPLFLAENQWALWRSLVRRDIAPWWSLIPQKSLQRMENGDSRSSGSLIEYKG
jgi:hypothetical protein